MAKAIMSSASASAFATTGLVDGSVPVRPNQIVLNNSLGAVHTVAGFAANQRKGDVFDVINKGTSPLILAAGDTAASAKDRFASGMSLPAGGSLRIYYNGLTFEPYRNSGTSGSPITKVVSFTENATATTHTGSVVLPAGAFLMSIRVLNPVLWTGGTAVMKVGDTADDDGYFIGIDLKATDLLVGEVLDTESSTLWGGKEGAYLVAASGRRGPLTTNFGQYQAAGTTITGVVTVGTPATTVGRTFMIVTYLNPGDTTAAVAA